MHERVMTQNMTSWDLTYFLMRANYDGVKSDYCDVPEPLPHHGKAIHLHGHKVTSFETTPYGGVRVHYIDTRSGSNDAATMDSDILIAADGHHPPSAQICSPTHDAPSPATAHSEAQSRNTQSPLQRSSPSANVSPSSTPPESKSSPTSSLASTGPSSQANVS